MHANDNMNVGVCGGRRGHTFVPAAFAAAPVRLGGGRGGGGGVLLLHGY